MSNLGFNTDIFLWGACGIVLTIAVYFVMNYILGNLSEDQVNGNEQRAIKKWYKIIAVAMWSIFFAVMILFHGVRWKTVDTHDMGSVERAEEALAYKGPTRDEILEMNKVGVNRAMKEREEERKAASAASSEEYAKFLASQSAH